MGRPRRRNRRGEGSVYRRGRLWSIVWVEDGVKRYSHGYLNPDDAAQVRASIAANIQAGRPGMKERPKPPQATFGELVDEFMDYRREHEIRTVGDDRLRWERHLGPVIGHLTPDGLSLAFLDNLIASLRHPAPGTRDARGRLKGPLSPGSTRLVVNLLSAFYQWAAKHHGIGPNPCRGASKDNAVKRLLRTTHNPKKVPFLKTKEDVARLFQALPEPVNIAFALSALAGLRPGEAIGLLWSDVDLGANQIHVQRQVRHGVEGIPKSGKDRDVPIVPSLKSVLEKWRKKNPDALLVVPSLRKNKKYLNWRTVKGAFTDALKACELTPMTFYQAGRHTFASQWVLSGNSIYRLRDIMGHGSVMVTERYAHLTSQPTDAELQRADVKLAS